MADTSIIVYFGKHKGKRIDEIPSDYLQWLIGASADEEISEAAEEEYSYREHYNCHIWAE